MTFKIFQGGVYLIAEEIPDKMFDELFDIQLHTKNNSNSRSIGTIKTPSKLEFSLVDFLDKYLTSSPFNFKKL
jgi:hypothetical protein